MKTELRLPLRTCDASSKEQLSTPGQGIKLQKAVVPPTQLFPMRLGRPVDFGRYARNTHQPFDKNWQVHKVLRYDPIESFHLHPKHAEVLA